MAPDSEATRALNTLIETATSLLQQLQTILTEIQRNPSSSSTTDTQASDIDALALARDSASLIRAHGTKISLFIINEPFTPSAIASVIRELVKGAIPGLATAAQTCESKHYTAVVRKELAYRAHRALSELGNLLKKVPRDGKVLSGGSKDGGKGSLALTGMLWSACDDVVGLANMGVGGFFVKKAEEWRDTLKDVMEEMKEWGEEEEDSDEEDDVDQVTDKLDDVSISKQDMLDDLMNSQQAIPRSDPDKIRPRLDSSLKRLRLVVLLYQALSKRRFKKLPALPPRDATSPDIPKRLDDMACVLEQLPDKFGDLAGAFYELDPEEIDRLMGECFESAVEAGEAVRIGWEGGRDEFSDWMDKFEVEVRKK
ncbi:hypothetical protein ACJ41O_009190 [Fusarium nematophilum]